MNKEKLEHLVNQGYSSYRIADEVEMSQTNVRYWLTKYGLVLNSSKTQAEKKIAKCGYCNKSILARKKYCDILCQNLKQKQDKLNGWLTTGTCVVGSSKTHYVREFLYKEQQYKCAVCLSSNFHNEKELNFVLDHINGNSSDNRRENLRLVCPNCDSQLDTYKSKNKGNGRHFRRQRYAEGKSF